MRLSSFHALIIGSILLSACGVKFGSPAEGNDFFKSLTISGDHHAGSTMTAVVLVRQRYSEQIDVRCEVRKGKDLYKPVGQDAVPKHPNGNPTATPFPANFSYDFRIDEAGTYKFECFTPKDEDNYIIKEFTVGSALTPTPGEQRPSGTPAP